MVLIIVLILGFIFFFNGLLLDHDYTPKTAILFFAIATACFWYFAINIHS